jgi:hypothetical protein
MGIDLIYNRKVRKMRIQIQDLIDSEDQIQIGKEISDETQKEIQKKVSMRMDFANDSEISEILRIIESIDGKEKRDHIENLIYR